MTAGIAVFVFLACLITMLASSEVLVRGLTVLGSKLHLTEGFLGLLTALGADAPEISSAIAALLAVLLIPYVLLVGLHPRQVDHLPLPDGLAHMLAIAASQIHGEHKHQQETGGSWLPVFLVPFSLLTIVLTSVGMVQAALTLAHIWHLPHTFVGGVILAALTSLPNAYTTAHLARRERGAAVVSATVNSNTINLVVGLALPALLIGMGSPAHGVGLELAWLLGMTVISLLLLLPTKGMTRIGGAALIVLYLLFVVVYLFWATA